MPSSGPATVAASAIGAAGAAAAADKTEDKTKLGGVHAIPELAPQWQQIDLVKVLKYPAAFVVSAPTVPSEPGSL